MVVRDGIYVREEVMMLVVRLPTSGLQISTSTLKYAEKNWDGTLFNVWFWCVFLGFGVFGGVVSC